MDRRRAAIKNYLNDALINLIARPGRGKGRSTRKLVMKISIPVIIVTLGLTSTSWAQSPLPATSRSPLSNSAAAEDKSIRPFHVSFPKEAVADMRKRVAATRWPDKETVADASQGVQLATMQKLARYWATDYDWRKVRGEAEGAAAIRDHDRWVDIHFIHVRSKHAECVAGHHHARLARFDH